MQGDSSLYLIPGRLIMPPKKLTSQRQWNWYRRWTASWFWNSKYTHITDVVGINSSLDELGHVRREVVLVNNFFPFGFIQYLQRKSKDDIWQPNLQTVNWKTISKKSDFQVRFCWNKIVSTQSHVHNYFRRMKWRWAQGRNWECQSASKVYSHHSAVCCWSLLAFVLESQSLKWIWFDQDAFCRCTERR